MTVQQNNNSKVHFRVSGFPSHGLLTKIVVPSMTFLVEQASNSAREQLVIPQQSCRRYTRRMFLSGSVCGEDHWCLLPSAACLILFLLSSLSLSCYSPHQSPSTFTSKIFENPLLSSLSRKQKPFFGQGKQNSKCKVIQGKKACTGISDTRKMTFCYKEQTWACAGGQRAEKTDLSTLLKELPREWSQTISAVTTKSLKQQLQHHDANRANQNHAGVSLKSFLLREDRDLHV